MLRHFLFFLNNGLDFLFVHSFVPEFHAHLKIIHRIFFISQAKFQSNTSIVTLNFGVGDPNEVSLNIHVEFHLDPAIFYLSAVAVLCCWHCSHVDKNLPDLMFHGQSNNTRAGFFA